VGRTNSEADSFHSIKSLIDFDNLLGVVGCFGMVVYIVSGGDHLLEGLNINKKLEIIKSSGPQKQ